MKHPKNLKVTMKRLISKNGLNPDDYWYIKDTPGCLVIIHKKTNEIIEIMK